MAVRGKSAFPERPIEKDWTWRSPNPFGGRKTNITSFHSRNGLTCAKFKFYESIHFWNWKNHKNSYFHEFGGFPLKCLIGCKRKKCISWAPHRKIMNVAHSKPFWGKKGLHQSFWSPVSAWALSHWKLMNGHIFDFEKITKIHFFMILEDFF